MRLNLAGGPDEKRIVNIERFGQKRASAASTASVSANTGAAPTSGTILFNHSLPEGGVGTAMRVLFNRFRRG